ncbi:hypothetical protein K456DRAFT_32304 [Colletotrichum gloeosporioides 23]|nr:hypothetical protein K456DRAFT_32304 [Colletotrichum gloeosporioides 23]
MRPQGTFNHIPLPASRRRRPAGHPFFSPHSQGDQKRVNRTRGGMACSLRRKGAGVLVVESERLRNFMPQGGIHQWQPQAGEVCGFRSRSRARGLPAGRGRTKYTQRRALAIWRGPGHGRSRLLGWADTNGDHGWFYRTGSGKRSPFFGHSVKARQHSGRRRRRRRRGSVRNPCRAGRGTDQTWCLPLRTRTGLRRTVRGGMVDACPVDGSDPGTDLRVHGSAGLRNKRGDVKQERWAAEGGDGWWWYG